MYCIKNILARPVYRSRIYFFLFFFKLPCLNAQAILDSVVLPDGRPIEILSNFTWREKPPVLHPIIAKTVKIGKLEWAAENLNTDTFSDGSIIPRANNFMEWEIAIRNRRPIWCYYNFDSTNSLGFGKLYNSYAIKDLRGLAPIGWRIPELEEWKYVIEGQYDPLPTQKDNRTRFLTTHTLTGSSLPNENGLKLPAGGYLDINKKFRAKGTVGLWWSSSISGIISKMLWAIRCDGDITYQPINFYLGLSVRLLKDTSAAYLASVKIENKRITTKNLRLPDFRTGDNLKLAANRTQWIQFCNSGIPAYCYPNFDAKKAEQYGFIYNWYAIADRRGLAPEGWHVATKEDWLKIMDPLGQNLETDTLFASTFKSKRWTQNIIGNNALGLDMLPGGIQDDYRGYLGENRLSAWWAPAPLDTKYIWAFSLNTNVNLVSTNRLTGLYVRLVKDE